MIKTIKPLEEMANDVKQGDLVKVFLEHSNFVGYRWDLDKSTVQDQLLLPLDFDVIFCSLNPYGNTRMEGDGVWIKKGKIGRVGDGEIVRDKIQFVGVNLERAMLGNENVLGYEILEKYEGPID